MSIRKIYVDKQDHADVREMLNDNTNRNTSMSDRCCHPLFKSCKIRDPIRLHSLVLYSNDQNHEDKKFVGHCKAIFSDNNIQNL
jgi:hypothetical protein